MTDEQSQNDLNQSIDPTGQWRWDGQIDDDGPADGSQARGEAERR